MFTEHAIKLSTSMAKGEGLFWWRPMYVGGVEKELPCYKCPFRILGFHLRSAHSHKCLARGVAVKSIVPLCLHQFCASSFPKRFWLDDSIYWAFFRNIEDKCDSSFHSAVIWEKKQNFFQLICMTAFDLGKKSAVPPQAVMQSACLLHTDLKPPYWNARNTTPVFGVIQ